MNTRKTKVAIYVRVSTDQQTHDSQLNELRDYCRRRCWSDVTEHPDVISGAKFSRQGLIARRLGLPVSSAHTQVRDAKFIGWTGTTAQSAPSLEQHHVST